MLGVDPSDARLAFARMHPAAGLAGFQQGDAIALPFEPGRFDAAVMALVIFFVPDPAKGVAEKARVVRPGGLVASYAWDVLDGGAPPEVIQAQMREMGMTPLLPPRSDVSRMAALQALWADAGLQGIATRAFTVQRTFDGFDDFWATTAGMPALQASLIELRSDAVSELKTRVCAANAADASGRITLSARANAIKGLVPTTM